jgi:hypothetical protein
MRRERLRPDDLAYREWHRPASISRYMSVSEADSLSLIDGDLIATCPRCRKTLLIMEVTRDYGQAKSGRIIEELARDAGTSAALIWYTQSRDPAATFTTKAGTFFDLTSFRVQRLWPPPRCVAVYDPPGWAAALLKLRRDHYVLEAEACSRRTAEWREREAAA